MNSLPKLVVSTTLNQVDWNNSSLIKSNVAEEVAQCPPPEFVAQHPEGPGGVAEARGGHGRRPAIDEVGAQRLVLALTRTLGLQEEALVSRYPIG